MKNQLTDLNDHLMANLERLSDESLNGEALLQELQRTKGVTSVAREIISNAQLVLDAHQAIAVDRIAPLPMLQDKR